LALLGRNQVSFVHVMAGLSAAWAFGFWLGGQRLGVRVCRGRRRGGIGGVLATAFALGELSFQFGNPSREFRHARSQQVNLSRLPLDQSEDFGRQRGQDFRRYYGWCIHAAAEHSRMRAFELYRVVNGYLNKARIGSRGAGHTTGRTVSAYVLPSVGVWKTN
jgi:hypothetical protein